MPQFASDVLALKVLHLEKHLRLKQARTIAQPTEEEEENCRHCLSTGILSQSTLSHGESRLGNPAPRCPALKLQLASNGDVEPPTLLSPLGPGLLFHIKRTLKRSLLLTQPRAETPFFQRFHLHLEEHNRWP